MPTIASGPESAESPLKVVLEAETMPPMINMAIATEAIRQITAIISLIF
jgi:hypothetical protein